MSYFEILQVFIRLIIICLIVGIPMFLCYEETRNIKSIILFIVSLFIVVTVFFIITVLMMSLNNFMIKNDLIYK